MLKVVGWIDYDNFNFATAEGTKEEINCVAENIRENGYKIGGDDHENYSNCCPLLSNGKALRLSWRNWGYVMAVAYNLKTEKGDYNYILWYMGEYAPEKRVLPKYAPPDLDGLPKGKAIDYYLTEKEYTAINNVSFTTLVLPTDYYNKINLKALDVVNFYYNGKLILETYVDDTRFAYYNLSELFSKDEFLSFAPSENTNLRLYTSEEAEVFIKNKYKVDNVNVILIFLNVSNDNRNDNEVYA